MGAVRGNVSDFLAVHHPLLTTATGVGAATTCVMAGGIKKIYAAYKDTMFDWPRKIQPPRKPRKKPALDKLREAWQDLKDKIAGAGAGRRLRADPGSQT